MSRVACEQHILDQAMLRVLENGAALPPVLHVDSSLKQCSEDSCEVAVECPHSGPVVLL